jgi:hypothetical protein
VLPGLDIAAVRHFSEQRVPPHALHQVRLEAQVTRSAVTIVERRAPWRPDYGPQWTSRGIARLRYTKSIGRWTLYLSDRNERWHLYDRIDPSENVLDLLDETATPPASSADRRSRVCSCSSEAAARATTGVVTASRSSVAAV